MYRIKTKESIKNHPEFNVEIEKEFNKHKSCIYIFKDWDNDMATTMYGHLSKIIDVPIHRVTHRDFRYDCCVWTINFIEEVING